jgi:hypothetical protein
VKQYLFREAKLILVKQLVQFLQLKSNNYIAEKIIRKEDNPMFSNLYATLSGSPTLATIDDKRPALKNVLDDFD